MPRRKGLYIAFEGGEACGKSTQARLLTERIGERALLTYEPGGTGLGARLRAILLDPATGGDMDDMTEAYLMAADRSEHMAKVVSPQIKKGGHVVSDRTFVSSLAYQGAARGLGEQEILNLNLANTGLLTPDFMIIMGEVSAEERSIRLAAFGKPDRIEAAGRDFHTKVAESFGRMVDTLANDSRTESIKTVYIEQEAAGVQKDIPSLHEEICAKLVDYCQETSVVCPI
ncbi:MAG: hypothetical protein QG623_108 [Patescibacteria group bacterium]|nr:hypothetical protein [Patescibacteria group bacterium]